MIKVSILASGKGNRVGEATPKQFAELAGIPVIIRSVLPFEMCEEVDEILIVTLEQYVDYTWELLSEFAIRKVKKVVTGGHTRQESSYRGIIACGEETSLIIIHDAARPLIDIELVSRTINETRKRDAVTAAVGVTDTIAITSDDGRIESIQQRSRLSTVQTPQGFRYSVIKTAHEYAAKNGVTGSSDDSSLVVMYGHPVFIFSGYPDNIKITYPKDLSVAENILENKKMAEAESRES